ncbi:MAG: precorrin-8X methylmutase [Eubacteriaceae bacterium]|nr:precorrin-8X methylmutase [Eubacteriaceae bacterium]
MDYVVKPMAIEEKSFEIIDLEMDPKLRNSFTKEELMVIKRVIHTSADFEYSEITKFINEPISHAIRSIKKGVKIYADTNMIKAGINPRTLGRMGCEIVNYVAKPEVIEEAKLRGVTRSIVSMEKACRNPDIKIFIIGNAPTALFTLSEKIRKGEVKPDLVIAVPVGFVGAKESKEDFSLTGIPSVVVNGRKGGSTIAVAIFNAILYLIDNER